MKIYEPEIIDNTVQPRATEYKYATKIDYDYDSFTVIIRSEKLDTPLE